MRLSEELYKNIAYEKEYEIRNKKMKALFSKYNRSEIIGTMAETISLKEILNCFSGTDVIQPENKEIKTVGTYYTWMYNGGVQRILASLICLWVEMGYRVVLYTDQPENENDYFYPETVKRVVVPNTRNAYLRTVFWNKTIQKESIDIMVYHEWMSDYLIWDMLLIKSLHIPFVLYTHGHFTAIYNSCNTYVMNSHEVFRICDLVVSLAECNARFYEMCGCRSLMLHNPISTELLENKVLAKLDNHNILWIGRICDGKRLEEAIEIFEIILKRIGDAKLFIVGSGTENEMRKIRLFCEEKGITSSVYFEGFQADVGVYYRNAAMMLMTSEKEGYPTVILECKAYGVPIVMYNLPYLTLTKDQKGIRVAEIGDIGTMAAKAIEILLDTKMRLDLGHDAYKSFEMLKQYNLQEKWRNIFDSFSHYSENAPDNTADQLLMQMFLEQLRIGINYDHMNSIDYLIGKNLLMLPRKMYHFYRKLKNIYYRRKVGEQYGGE